MGKGDVVYTFNRMLLSQEKNATPFAATWMNPEIIILSEVSQRKTNIIYHLYVGCKKLIQINLVTKQKLTHRHSKQTYSFQREHMEGG